MQGRKTGRPDRKGELSAEGLSLAVTNYQHIEQQATLAITKAALLVAAQSILLSAYIGFAKDYKVWESYPWMGWQLSAVCFSGALLVAGLFFSLWAIFPKSKPDAQDDVLFFRAICECKSPADFVRKYFAADSRGFDVMLLENIYGKSGWLRRHFRWVQISISCTIAGMSVAVITGILLVATRDLP